MENRLLFPQALTGGSRRRVRQAIGASNISSPARGHFNNSLIRGKLITQASRTETLDRSSPRRRGHFLRRFRHGRPVFNGRTRSPPEQRPLEQSLGNKSSAASRFTERRDGREIHPRPFALGRVRHGGSPRKNRRPHVRS